MVQIITELLRRIIAFSLRYLRRGSHQGIGQAMPIPPNDQPDSGRVVALPISGWLTSRLSSCGLTKLLADDESSQHDLQNLAQRKRSAVEPPVLVYSQRMFHPLFSNQGAASMPTVSQYINSVTLYDSIIKERTGGLTHEDSMKQLPVPANCMNWVLGHIMVYRVRNLGVIDGATQPDPAEWMLYGAGSEPLTDGSIAIPLETLLTRIADASEVLISALQSMPQERLGELFDAESGTTIDERLNYYLVFHEAYHLGQLEVLQELALAGKQA